MPTSNQEILDRYIRHQIYLLKYAGGLRNKSVEILNKTDKELRNIILSSISGVPNRTLTGKAGRVWVAAYTKAITELRIGAWKTIEAGLDYEFKELAVAEAATAANIIEGAVPVILNLTLPPTQQLISVVNSQPFEGYTLKQWVKRTANADVQNISPFSAHAVSSQNNRVGVIPRIILEAKAPSLDLLS